MMRRDRGVSVLLALSACLHACSTPPPPQTPAPATPQPQGPVPVDPTTPRPPYLDPDLPLEARVENLLARMTLEEKVSQTLYDAPAIERLDIPAGAG